MLLSIVKMQKKKNIITLCLDYYCQENFQIKIQLLRWGKHWAFNMFQIPKNTLMRTH